LEDRGQHLKDCPFVPRVYKPNQNLTGTNPTAKPLNLHSSVSEPADVQDHVPIRYSGRRRFRLSGFLYNLVAKAEINRIAQCIPKPEDTAQALANAIRGERLAQGVAAEDLFFVGVGVNPFPNTIATLEMDQHTWPNGVRPYALAIGIFDVVQGRTLICQRTNSKVLCIGQVKFLPCAGPYLVLGTVAEDLRFPGRFTPVHAFGLPILSRSVWYPVESHFERMVFISLHWILKNLLSSVGAVTVEKPLNALRPTEDIPEVRPDFLLHAKCGTLVIEVMGSETDNYQERKIRLIPFMAHLGPVLIINATSIDGRGRWLKVLGKLTYFLSKWVNGDFRPGEIYDLESLPEAKVHHHQAYVQFLNA
jgi:hypothetical protein